MKNKVLPLVLLALFVSGYSFITFSKSDYSSEHNYTDLDDEIESRIIKLVTKEKIGEAKYISDIIPNHPMQWNEIINYVSIELLAINNGKTISSSGTSYSLNAEQKTILNSVDFGSDIEIKIKFMYKDSSNDNVGSNRKIKEMDFVVKAVPHKEAEYPGGNKKITNYFTENVINKISEYNSNDASTPAIVVYTVNEEGQVVDAKLSKISSNTLINKLLLDAVNNMPKWKPAKNAKGANVKEEFKISIPFYFRNGC